MARVFSDHTAFPKLKPFLESSEAQSTLSFYVNGTKITLNNPDPEHTLLDFIRSQPCLKGTKLGCGEGGCGACTCVIQTYEAGRTRHLAVNACLFPLVGVVGKHVITIEGIGNVDNPHPLQERIAKLHGSQCGFCTPGIVMSLYALVRNSFDPISKCFHLSANDVELAGHLDGNLCRCTGYGPILKAAKTFITDDLKGKLINSIDSDTASADKTPHMFQTTDEIKRQPSFSCGRPGGCCRDEKMPAVGLEEQILPSPKTSLSSSDEAVDSHESDMASSTTSRGSLEEDHKSVPTVGATYGKPLKSKETAEVGAQVEGLKTATTSVASVLNKAKNYPQYDFKPYVPTSELLFPPALLKTTKALNAATICFGDSKRIWLRPVTLQQLLEIKNVVPSATIVGGSSEVQVEVRFKNNPVAVCVYVSDIEELKGFELPEDSEIETMEELVIRANTPLTDVEEMCKLLYGKLGHRGQVLEATRKQLRYFAGRQIRNVASLAGNIATASPISDMNPVLVASNARLTCQSLVRRTFTLTMSSFFESYRTTSLPLDAVITKIHIPLPKSESREIMKAYKQSKRKDDDIAIVTAAFRVRLDKDGIVEDICFAFGGMAPKTVEAPKTMELLMGKRWQEPKTLDEAMSALADDFNLGYGVPGGMATYRRTLSISLFFRYWHEVVCDLKLAEVDPYLVNEIHRSVSSSRRDDYNPYEQRVVGKQIPHLSGLKQATGEAEYVDDMPRQDRELFGAMVLSTKAHAKIVSIDWEPALVDEMALGYVDKNEIPEAANLWGSIRKDEPFFADGKVMSHGQPIGMVFAETALRAATAAKAVKVIYEDLPVIITIDEAIAAKSFFPHGKMLKKGAAQQDKMADVWASCDKVFEGTTRMGGQEHFYLETQAALVIPHIEDGSIEVWSSTQNTMEVQEFVSAVTGVPSNRINSRVRRMGGAFGGKESRAVQLAALCAVVAKKTRRPCRAMLSRDEDMMTTGQRHPFKCTWKVGVTKDGKLVALEADLYNNGGFSQDMSGAVMDRAVTHIDNCYYFPNALIQGHVCRTNTHSNTAFRGFGGPQGMYITECFMYAISEGLNIAIEDIRQKNLYKEGDLTPFLQPMDEDWHVPMLLDQVREEAKYDERKRQIEEFNAKNTWKKRGLAMIPTKFGLSFATAIHLNQANASIKIFADGSILLHHGGTEMGQGLYTKMAQVASQELGVPIDAVFTQSTDSYQTANASPTAASSGSDLNGMAVKDACDQLNERLKPIREKFGADAPMKTIAYAAYLARINLNAHGFWKMPKIGYIWGNYVDPKPMYYYFTQGVSCSEIELDVLTGDHTVLRTDIKMDIGRSINPGIDYGQVEGAFVQGQGLYTMEETLWLQSGVLATRGPGTYKIPGFSDISQQLNLSFLQNVPGGWKGVRSIQSSKGIGEPPVFMGASVLFALRDALTSARRDNGITETLQLDSPATAERMRLLIGDDLLRRGTVVPTNGEKEFFIRAE